MNIRNHRMSSDYQLLRSNQQAIVRSIYTLGASQWLFITTTTNGGEKLC